MTDTLNELKRLYRRVMLMTSYGQVTAVDDGDRVQKLQVRWTSPFEIRDNTYRPMEFGLASNPPIGADVVALFGGGDRSNGVVVALNHGDHRPKNLKSGETQVYNSHNMRVYLSEDGVLIDNGAGMTVNVDKNGIVVDGGGKMIKFTNTTNVRVESPLLSCTGDITAHVS